MKNDKLKYKLFLLGFGLFFGLLIAEIGVRLYKYMLFTNLDDIEFDSRPPMRQADQELRLGQIIQISSSENIIYELIPNSIYQYIGVRVETNDRGFRDKNYPKRKQDGTKRIIGIGDSNMFGWGVREEYCFLTQLENQLNQNGGSAYEVINTAVPGYNTVMEVAVLEEKIQLDQVDIVIVNFDGNDFKLPSFIRTRPNFLTLRKSFVLMLLEDTFIDEHRSQVQWLGVPSSGIEAEENPDKVPEKHRDMIGQKNYVRAMERLEELSDTFGFKVMVLSQSPFLDVPDIVPQTCENLNFEFIDFKIHWDAIKAENPNLKWKLSETDWHPSQDGHREIAKVLVEKIHLHFD